MILEEGLVAELRADAGVSAIVGSGSDAQIYSEVVPQGVDGAAIVHARIGTAREQMLEGPLALVTARIRLDLWQTSSALMWALADAVRAVLNVGGTSVLGSVAVQQIYLDEEYVLSVFEGDRRDYRVIQEYVVRYVEV